MNRWIRSIAAFLPVLLLGSVVHAGPPPPPGSSDRLKAVLSPPQEAPLPVFRVAPTCTTGPAPQLQFEAVAVYAHFAWLKVPGATEYFITRYSSAIDRSPIRITPEHFNPAPSPYALEYWDHPTE